MSEDPFNGFLPHDDSFLPEDDFEDIFRDELIPDVPPTFSQFATAPPVPLAEREFTPKFTVGSGGSGRKRGLDERKSSGGLTKKQKVELRKLKNRESAMRSRARQKEYLVELESQNRGLSGTVSQQSQKLAALEAENTALKQQLSFLQNLVTTMSSTVSGGAPPLPCAPPPAAPVFFSSTAPTTRKAGGVMLCVVVFLVAFCVDPGIVPGMAAADHPIGSGRVLLSADGGGNGSQLGIGETLDFWYDLIVASSARTALRGAVLAAVLVAVWRMWSFKRGPGLPVRSQDAVRTTPSPLPSNLEEGSGEEKEDEASHRQRRGGWRGGGARDGLK